MKKIAAVFFSIMLLSFGYSMNTEAYALTPIEEKENIIQDLEIIKNNSDVKKTKKSIGSAIKQIEKSLKDKFWKDESTLNFKSGKKVFNADQNAVNKLDKILKNKKESDSIKADILQINIRIAEVDKALVGNGIESIEDIIMSDKGIKKIDNAIKKFEKGNEFLEDDNYSKANKNYGKAWDQIKKALKDPKFKKMKIVELEGSDDMNFDGADDVYLKVIKPNKPNKPKQLEMKITGECVNGIDHESARMKIGLSAPHPTPGIRTLDFFDEEFHATNKWFKQNDPDKRIDPVIITTDHEYFIFPESTGDDLIQKNIETGAESFEFSSEPITEIGDQSGWSGKFRFDADPGDYLLHFWFPLTEPTIDGDNCNFIASFSIEQTFE
ncbi:MAG: hypothetical protein ACE5DT_07295 [Nitrosopumilus sp.]